MIGGDRWMIDGFRYRSTHPTWAIFPIFRGLNNTPAIVGNLYSPPPGLLQVFDF
jgi:hypothetical protein